MSEGELPYGWVSLKLRDFVTKVGSGATPHGGSDVYKASGTPLIRSMNIHFDGFKSDGLVFLDDKQAAALSSVEVLEDDVLLNITGASIGRVTIAPSSLSGARVNQHVSIIRCASTVAPRYLQRFIASPSLQRHIFAEEAGATRQALTKSKILDFDVPLPPLSEQRRIVAKIEALQARSDATKEALDAIPPLLEKFRQSVLAAAFRGDLTREWRAKNPDVEPASVLLERIRKERKTRFVEDAAEKARAKAEAKAVANGAKWTAADNAKVLKAERAKAEKTYEAPKPVDAAGLPELPEGWCWARWQEVGFCQNGRAFPSEHYTDRGVKLLRPGNLDASGRVAWSTHNTKYMPEEWAVEYPGFVIGARELVMNLTAQSLKDEFLGRVCLTEDGERCMLNQRIARLSGVQLMPEFCLWLFKSRVFRRYVEDGLNTGSLIQHMFTSQVDEFVFPLPPAAEQAALIDSIEGLMAAHRRLASAVDATGARLPTLDHSILARAFRGELVPQDPNDEPASVLLERIRAERAHGDDGKAEAKKPGKPGRPRTAK